MNEPTIEMYMEIDQRIYLELCYVHSTSHGIHYLSVCKFFFFLCVLVIDDVLYLEEKMQQIAGVIYCWMILNLMKPIKLTG